MFISDESIFLSPYQYELTAMQAAVWKQAFLGYSCAQIYEVIKNGLPPYNDNEKVRLDFLGNNLWVNYSSLLKDKFEINEFFKINIESHTCVLENVRVKQGKRNGYATQILKNLIELCKISGVENISVSTKDDGGYVWLLLGFLPDISPIQYNAELDAKLSKVYSQLPEPTKLLLHELMISEDPLAWRLIVNIPEDVEHGGRKYKLGEFLTLELKWNGSFKIHDPETVRWFEIYEQNKRQQR